MRNIVKGIMIVATAMLAWVATPAQGQNGLNAPFSQYGIGQCDLPYNIPAIAGMGGIGLTRSANNMINPFNPASYATIEKESFIFDMGLNIEMSTLKDKNQSLYDADGNIGYLYFGLPLTKWWKTAFGLMPYSDVNYQSVHEQSSPVFGDMKTIYEGTGGVAQLFWGHGFNIIGGHDATKPALRGGFNVNLLYGKLTRALTYDFLANDTTYFMDSRRQKDTYVRNFTFDFGLQYDQPLGEKYLLTLGATLRPHQKMNVRDNALVYTFVTYGGSEYMRDTIFPHGGDSEYKSTLEQAMEVGLGVSLTRNDRWRVAAEGNIAPWKGMKYEENSQVQIFGASPLRYNDFYRFAVGVQLLGDPKESRYLRRVSYSAGFHTESGKLALQTSDGKDYTLGSWGIGAGIALPMRKGRSVMNLTVSYNSFGDKDLLKRNTVMVGISLGSCESWFVKRKYN
ncbi:MAG: hypothetical protein K5864_04770 [Bacteroidales bacterium]|nr:hypothetical protein [Bacteroidales bacterium]